MVNYRKMAPQRAVAKRGSQKPKNRQTKVNLIFDEKARKEYLTGFRKRKVERRIKFAEKLKKELKSERKRLQTELREKIKKSNRDVPEVAHLVEKQTLPNVFELPEHTVTISSITDATLRDENLFLGSNNGIGNDSDDESQTIEGKKKQVKDLNRQAMKKLQKTKAYKRLNQVARDKSRKKSKRSKAKNTKKKSKNY